MAKAGLSLKRDPEAIESFKSEVRKRFKAENVHVDIFDRTRSGADGEVYRLIQVTVYRDGHLNDVLEFVKGELTRRSMRPVIEAALTYEPETGVIEVVANVRENRKDFVDLFSGALLNHRSTKNPLPLRKYDLSRLTRPYDFPTDPEDGIEMVRVATTHLSKANGKAINRIIGSIAFVAAARTAFTVVEDPGEEGRRLLLQIKNNIAPPQPGLAFRLEQREVAPGVIGSAVMWDETVSVSVTADEALAGVNHQSSAKEDAVEFLRDLLCGGPMAVRDIERHAVEAAMLEEGKPIGQAKPFRLARQVLEIKPRRSGGLGGDGSWVWELPDEAKMPSAPYDAPVREEGILASGRHLSGEGGKP
jgi:hypothetical protein